MSENIGNSMGNLLDKVYPIGSIYINVNDINPNGLIGGIWEKIYGRFLLSVSNDYALGTEGGEANHTLTQYEMPSHTHRFSQDATGSTTGYAIVDQATNKSTNTWGVHWENATGYYAANGYLYETGGNGSHNNMPPYLVVNMWKRVR